MSELARAEFDDARIQQTTQNDARRIFQRVDAAQQNPTRAGVRWPFELIQNAHDAGPRDGDDRVQINFVLRDDRLTVSHTGKPFVAQELAALLSGGSSKEFDSEETTGRFGTGFLVTHSVSTRVDVEGVLTTQEGSEVFRIKLDRDGDEDSIIGNIEQANESLENAEPALEAWVSSNPTASFIYHNPSSDVVRRGLDRLEQTLPYLYATCSKLGRVVIQRFGEAKSFEPECLDKSNEGDFDIYKTQVNISTACGSSMVTAVRIGPADGQSALLTVLEHCGTDERQVLVPTEGFARVFVKFPVAGTDFLPFNVALEGNFAISQERDGIAMNDTDRTAIDGALSAFPTLIQHAVEFGWRDAHKLASLAAPTRTFSGEAESGELQWWNEIVLQTATQTASKPLVQTELGLLPALPEQGREFVSFPVPAIAADATECIDYDTFHAVVGGVTELNLPSVEVAESWGGIARQWGQAGVPVNRLGLSELTNLLKEKGDLVSDLPIHGESYSWLAQLFLLAADLKDQNVRDMVNGLLPNQHDELCNTTTDLLYGDGGISQEVKDIASALNEDIRAELLHDAMAKALMAPGYESANELVRSLLEKTDIDGGDYTESKAIELILDQLAKVLPDESQFDDDTRLPALTASARMVVHIAGNEDVQRLRRCPLLTAAGRIVYLSGNQQILAPARYWPESAQPYAELYAENRLLSDSYCDENGLASALEALITVSLVVAAPLFEGRRAELADVNLLREMSQGEPDTVGAIVRDARFGQIAFLATDLMQRCGEKEELAKLLLDFVLNVAAREDQSWREIGSFAGNRSGERISLTMNKAIWPFELKVRSWIPVKAPDADAIAPMPANESNLREILDPSWLKGNRDAVDLLHQIFGFRQLTLLLDSFGTEIEGDLVELLQYPELVKAAANNPDALRFASELKDTDVTLDSVRDFVKDAAEDEKLLEHLANRRKQRRQVHENQNLGALIETLVRDNLKIAGFSVRRTGVGSDFEIAVETGHLANLHITKEKQSWLVEVKATRDQRVRMTDTQAKTAVDEENRFLLCVVPVESGDTNPQAADIWPNMRFVAGLGDRLANLCNNLGDFEDMRVDITADAATGVQLEISPGPARVRVASSVWEDDGSKYTVFDDSKDFEAALRGDMDQWELYLHPSQRYVVELPVQHRIGVQGSAGTGKTVCAWHRLGFLASQGHSVGFVCANKAILEVSRDMLERLVQGTSTNCYFLIPNSRDELVQLAEEVEHIVFDEGQEFTPAWFSHLGQALSDKNTGITLFFDLNQIGGNIPSGDSARFEERLNSWHSSLESIPNIVRMPFHINYRNSREIIEFYRNALDGALPGDLGSNLPTFEAGQVVSEEVKSREELGIRIGAAIRAFQKDYGDNDIGLILNGHARENMRDVLAQLGKLGIRTSPDLHDRHRILVTSPRDIKGHERKAIIFCTAPIGNRVGRVGRAIDAYVALTRARDRLVVLETT